MDSRHVGSKDNICDDRSANETYLFGVFILWIWLSITRICSWNTQDEDLYLILTNHSSCSLHIQILDDFGSVGTVVRDRAECFRSCPIYLRLEVFTEHKNYTIFDWSNTHRLSNEISFYKFISGSCGNLDVMTTSWKWGPKYAHISVKLVDFLVKYSVICSIYY